MRGPSHALVPLLFLGRKERHNRRTCRIATLCQIKSRALALPRAMSHAFSGDSWDPLILMSHAMQLSEIDRRDRKAEQVPYRVGGTRKRIRNRNLRSPSCGAFDQGPGPHRGLRGAFGVGPARGARRAWRPPVCGAFGPERSARRSMRLILPNVSYYLGPKDCLVARQATFEMGLDFSRTPLRGAAVFRRQICVFPYKKEKRGPTPPLLRRFPRAAQLVRSFTVTPAANSFERKASGSNTRYKTPILVSARTH